MALDTIQTLIMSQGVGSSDGLDVLVESQGGFVSGYDVTLSQTANQYASPQGRTISSVTRTENDQININGWVRCVFCNGQRNTASLEYLSRFKQVIEEQKYTVGALSTIFFNDGIMTNMRMTSVNFRRDGSLPQETLITSSWEQVNTAGDMNNPLFDLGGLQL